MFIWTERRCSALPSRVKGLVISNCTSGVPGVGYVGNTCIISYQDGVRVMEMWECKFSMSWVKVSGVLMIAKN